MGDERRRMDAEATAGDTGGGGAGTAKPAPGSARASSGPASAPGPGAPTGPASAPGPGANPSAEGPADATADAAADTAPVPQPPMLDLVQTFLNVLAARAWQHLGLVPDPSSGKVERRLEDAQLAIDAAAALAEVLRPRVGERDRREVETLITNLRLNFVEQKSRAQ